MAKKGVKTSTTIIIIAVVIIVAILLYFYLIQPQLSPINRKFLQRGVIEYHLECRNNACTKISGPGMNTCSPEGAQCGCGNPDYLKFEKASDKLNLGENLNQMFASLDDNEMPVALSDGTYTNTIGNTSDYEQKLTIPQGLKLKHFRDTDYEDLIGAADKTPTIGIPIVSNTPVFNFTLDFLSNPESAVQNNSLIYFENTNIEMMGKSYTITSFTINPISLTIVDAKSKQYVLQNDQEVTLNGNYIDGVKSFIYLTNTTNTYKIDKIIIEWKTDDELFIATQSSPKMPGFESFEFPYEGFTMPKDEKTTVQNDGSTSIELLAPIQDGEVAFNILYADVNGVIKGLGKDADQRLATSPTTTLTFYDTKNWSDYHSYFVASYRNQNQAESYLLRATAFIDGTPSNGNQDKTTIQKLAGNTWVDVCVDKVSGDVCNVGSVSLTLTNVSYLLGGATKSATLLAGNKVSFSTLYTKEGLSVYLPLETQIFAGMRNYALFASEENKDGNIGGGSSFTLTVSSNADNELQIGIVNASTPLEIGSTNTFESYMISPLATKVLHYKAPDQDYAEIYYHGEESYGNVYISSIIC